MRTNTEHFRDDVKQIVPVGHNFPPLSFTCSAERWVAEGVSQPASDWRRVRSPAGNWCASRFIRRRLRAMGVRERPTRPYSPWQNGYVERLIGSIRRECLDHVIILNAAHLRRVLRAYADYYNNDRTHLGLAKDAPRFRAIEAEGEIVSRPVLGGLHRRYGRRAAK